MRLERKRGSESWFSAIKDDHGRIVTDLDGIISAWLTFYTQLFSSCVTDPDVQSDMLSCLSLFLCRLPKSLYARVIFLLRKFYWP